LAHHHIAELFKNGRKKREDCLSPPEAGEFRSARLFLKNEGSPAKRDQCDRASLIFGSFSLGKQRK
jgi:hypothetical protein